MICDDCAFAARPSYKYPCSSCNMEEGSPGCKYEKIVDNSKYTFGLDNEGLYIYKDGKEYVAIKPIPGGVELSGEGVQKHGGISMDKQKEKLISMIQDAVGGCARHWAGVIADHLIDNGVTIQEPQKPVAHKVDVTAIAIGNARWGKGTTIYKCPKCGNFISRLYDYCFKCGQAFDWEKQPAEEGTTNGTI